MDKLFKIIKDNKKSLRVPSTPIEFPLKDRYYRLGRDMVEYLRLSQDSEYSSQHHLRSGVGLAGPQIGINKRIIAVYCPNYDDKGNETEATKYALVNPIITRSSVQLCAIKDGEGCLSVDEEHPGLVYRNENITVKAFDILQNKDVIIEAKGYIAIVLQHEIDHLNGILFYDRIGREPKIGNDPQPILI
jgi:peptide deformylase